MAEEPNSVPGLAPGAVVRATNNFRADVHVVRSAYLHQVAQIAPADLVGREAEQADLAEFCTSASTSGRYLWWRAEAWSGKTALMSSFVLAPPAGVRVVSFFVTGRLGGQNDRAAFVDNVLEQLLTLLGASVPELLTEATKQAHLLRLLDAAAAACRSRGESFVLLVDGLDEDDGAGGHSIASLLPVRPPDGMRVVVAGRPNPPADAPDDHPLRSGAAEIRSLKPSPAATAVRREMERELKALMFGTSLAKDLLGLVCAAGGGLTADDLAELTETSRYEVEDRLRTVAGRSFARRDDVYLLAHEELRVTATEMFGSRLAGHRDRLHAWARGYRDRGWPETTPEYLLHGYAPMLRSMPDLARVVELATDRERQARQLRQTGGDAAAHAEILAAQQVVAEHDPANLLAITKLAAARGDLDAHTGRLPVELPAVWELLGQPLRATALAHGIVNHRTRGHALSLLAPAVAESGDLDRAQDTADSITEPWWRMCALTQLAQIIAASGHSEHAEVVLTKAEAAVAEIIEAAERNRGIVAVARTFESLGHRERASAILGTVDESVVHDFTLTRRELAVCAEAIGDHRRAERIARNAADPLEQVILLAAVASEALAGGRGERAAPLLDDAEAIALRLDPFEQVLGLARICCSAVGLGSRSSRTADLAFASATNLDLEERGGVRADLVDCAVACGDLERAESTALSISESVDAASALVEVARLALSRGENERADALITRLISSYRHASALGDLALFVVRLGRRTTAAELAELAETASRGNVGLYRDQVAADVVSALCSLGWHDEAEAVAATVASPAKRARALGSVLTSVSPTGERERMNRLAAAVDSLRLEIETELDYREVCRTLVNALAAAEEADRAAAVVDSIPHDFTRVMVMAGAALAAAPTNPALAVELAGRAERAARSLAPGARQTPCADIAAAFDIAGNRHRAMTIIRETLPDVHHRDLAWLAMAEAAASSNDHERSRRLAERIEMLHNYQSALGHTAAAMARAGLTNEAEELAAELEINDARDTAMYGLALAVAAKGEWSLARQRVDTLRQKSRRPVLLGELAIMAADAGNPAMAKRFVLEAATTGQWSASLRALARVDPDAFQEIVAIVRAAS
ncbi:hypothetical protein SK803_24310 [Lentzea sp. BCCO 10_0856]|uniref:Nephrocystin 3-like N-terminal domain-containing protein n=1 Tax=Lentzea miocenica TaxID=3095431 RepID=A0ABU4T5J4_9PSEU|nr:hypothetical protein [Lentzea sp. BCCO 10_0856]MDX8033354.1 hypothetical protein [Lentzea sp. BCCO 10_0856]